ncbi:MAG: sigma-70 family RNA polymerase sigma factor [Deltaproteobacteria bacterium]|nr:sigma-70 family RNA polymerase sigma factor [Deltaproteobacteria bacterium]MBK8234356.1 sigma-70 family RNA polymerase sigma factor [Deltaproteobacteria bacterium]MBK8715082.1 sigma-70 family RNA polymerase sigma factor [Deltaproteobacteria bacterium]MBP7287098.1 sigma-70 family RNA polymerase sigma factor [Nannocystaceae bacterium]
MERGDDELLAAWRAGEAEAAEALFERHFDPLYRFFRNKADAAADELVQRTLLACFEGGAGFRGDSSFRTWLFAIARNQLLVFFAQQRRAERIEPGNDSVAAIAASPSSLLHRDHEQTLVLNALRRLPIDHQILLELFYWEQCSGRELADVLGVPEGTIRTRLRRARELLVQEVEALGARPELVHSTITDLDAWAAGLRGLRRSP